MNSPARIVLGLILAALAFLTISANTVQACEIKMKAIKGEKKSYSPGDIVVVKVTVFLTHRNCPEPLTKTKFQTVGMDIEGATKWKQTESLEYVRKLKIKISSAPGTPLTISATRTCDKEGGYAILNMRE